MSLPKTVALVVTDYYGPFYDTGVKTGAFFTEVYHPWLVLTRAGLKVQLVSESGSFNWDENSISGAYSTEEELAVLKEPNHPFNKFTAEIKAVKDVSAEDFGAVFAAGGHGTIFDFDENTPGLYKLFGDVNANQGIISAVCHGPLLLAFVKENGKPIVEGKRVTGFPDCGETIMQLDDTLKRTNKKRVMEILLAAKADWVEPTEPFGAFTVTDGRLVTGANPASATPVAEEVVKLLN